MSLMDKFKKKAPTDPKAWTDKKAKTLPAQELSVAELEAVKTKTAAPEVAAKLSKKEDTREAYRVIIKPLITEKGTYLNSQGKYIFKVSNRTNKVEIAKAIYHLYNVRPIKVNIVKNGRVKGQTSDWKKAIVTMPKGVTLSVYEGV
ncbi:MAG: 50S ribosomal protein L23 [Candidatus Komeilibacteria bacterium]|nr:50S ribosomal protein L23 [Candidatus Komeilibacteria bacterium]